MDNRLLTTSEAGEMLGVSGERVRQLVISGRLPAQKVGRDHLINARDLKLVADRKPGRPPLKPVKASAANNGRKRTAKKNTKR